MTRDSVKIANDIIERIDLDFLKLTEDDVSCLIKKRKETIQKLEKELEELK